MSAIPPKRYGLAGVGGTSRFDVEIDEAHDDPTDVQMSVTTRTWSFCFRLPSRAHATRMLVFLREHTGRLEFSELVVGSFQGVAVLLVKDQEFADRFWLRAHGGGQVVEFVLAADDLSHFTDAIAQAVQDL